MMRSIKGRRGLRRGRGFSESTRLKWVHTAHKCTAIHEAMTSFTSLHLTSSEQHIEMGKARCKADQTDEQKLSSWIQNHNPFTDSESLNGSLKALSSGIIADESTSVDCDKASQLVKKSKKTLMESNWNRPKLNEEMELLLLIQYSWYHGR